MLEATDAKRLFPLGGLNGRSRPVADHHQRQLCRYWSPANPVSGPVKGGEKTQISLVGELARKRKRSH
jgi:hypothetical protein